MWSADEHRDREAVLRKRMLTRPNLPLPEGQGAPVTTTTSSTENRSRVHPEADGAAAAAPAADAAADGHGQWWPRLTGMGTGSGGVPSLYDDDWHRDPCGIWNLFLRWVPGPERVRYLRHLDRWMRW